VGERGKHVVRGIKVGGFEKDTLGREGLRGNEPSPSEREKSGISKPT